MPQTNNKEEWAKFYRKQLRVFLPKNSGWYISNNGGNIKIEVKSGGKKETKTLPYAWNEQEMAIAVEEIKQIYKRYKEGSVHTLAAATSMAAVSNSTKEPKGILGLDLPFLRVSKISSSIGFAFFSLCLAASK